LRPSRRVICVALGLNRLCFGIDLSCPVCAIGLFTNVIAQLVNNMAQDPLPLLSFYLLLTA